MEERTELTVKLLDQLYSSHRKKRSISSNENVHYDRPHEIKSTPRLHDLNYPDPCKTYTKYHAIKQIPSSTEDSSGQHSIGFRNPVKEHRPQHKICIKHQKSLDSSSYQYSQKPTIVEKYTNPNTNPNPTPNPRHQYQLHSRREQNVSATSSHSYDVLYEQDLQKKERRDPNVSLSDRTAYPVSQKATPSQNVSPEYTNYVNSILFYHDQNEKTENISSASVINPHSSRMNSERVKHLRRRDEQSPKNLRTCSTNVGSEVFLDHHLLYSSKRDNPSSSRKCDATQSSFFRSDKAETSRQTKETSAIFEQVTQPQSYNSLYLDRIETQHFFHEPPKPDASRSKIELPTKDQRKSTVTESTNRSPWNKRKTTTKRTFSHRKGQPKSFPSNKTSPRDDYTLDPNVQLVVPHYVISGLYQRHIASQTPAPIFGETRHPIYNTATTINTFTSSTPPAVSKSNHSLNEPPMAQVRSKKNTSLTHSTLESFLKCPNTLPPASASTPTFFPTRQETYNRTTSFHNPHQQYSPFGGATPATDNVTIPVMPYVADKPIGQSSSNGTKFPYSSVGTINPPVSKCENVKPTRSKPTYSKISLLSKKRSSNPKPKPDPRSSFDFLQKASEKMVDELCGDVKSLGMTEIYSPQRVKDEGNETLNTNTDMKAPIITDKDNTKTARIEMHCVHKKMSAEKVKKEKTVPSLQLSQSSDDTMFDDNLDSEDDVSSITKIAIAGCTHAENIALSHQIRPCFKNIHHLCSRTKSDVQKPDCTVANINSQGMPWATKDFIFAFIRMANCWVIMKGYLNNHHDSLSRIEQCFSPGIRECFNRWQIHSKQLMKHLIHTFKNLDCESHRQRNTYPHNRQWSNGQSGFQLYKNTIGSQQPNTSNSHQTSSNQTDFRIKYSAGTGSETLTSSGLQGVVQITGGANTYKNKQNNSEASCNSVCVKCRTFKEELFNHSPYTFTKKIQPEFLLKPTYSTIVKKTMEDFMFQNTSSKDTNIDFSKNTKSYPEQEYISNAKHLNLNKSDRSIHLSSYTETSLHSEFLALNLEEQDSADERKHLPIVYMKPGSYNVPKKHHLISKVTKPLPNSESKYMLPGTHREHQGFMPVCDWLSATPMPDGCSLPSIQTNPSEMHSSTSKVKSSCETSSNGSYSGMQENSVPGDSNEMSSKREDSYDESDSNSMMSYGNNSDSSYDDFDESSSQQDDELETVNNDCSSSIERASSSTRISSAECLDENDLNNHESGACAVFADVVQVETSLRIINTDIPEYMHEANYELENSDRGAWEYNMFACIRCMEEAHAPIDSGRNTETSK